MIDKTSALLVSVFVGLLLGIGLAAAGVSAAESRSDDEADRSGAKDAQADKQRIDELKAAMQKLRPLHTRLGKPQPGDWLERFKEPGQTFQEYLKCYPVTPRSKRSVIYVQPLGKFTITQRRVVDLSAEFMGHYFNLKVKVRKDLPLSVIPAKARRKHPSWGMDQILSTYVLDKVLRPRLPDDAAAYIAFTPVDLWPGKGWNFVFGQASLRHRVGVWSIYRNGDPEKGAKEFRLCLLRTIKTAVHETGHMFSMKHCIAYECCMCGSNNRGESDRRPVALCPECLAKVCWATRTEPLGRYEKLSAFCKKTGLAEQYRFYQESIRALNESARGKAPAGSPSSGGGGATESSSSPAQRSEPDGGK